MLTRGKVGAAVFAGLAVATVISATAAAAPADRIKKTFSGYGHNEQEAYLTATHQMRIYESKENRLCGVARVRYVTVGMPEGNVIKAYLDATCKTRTGA